uniref:Uncharacterized protein n=1 Tax=Arundo donax TaxID=35708 RepID=A0A0A9FCE2_ARUDO
MLHPSVDLKRFEFQQNNLIYERQNGRSQLMP